MWQYVDDEPAPKAKGPVVTNIREAPRPTPTSLGELGLEFGIRSKKAFDEAYSRATDSSGAGTGEIGVLTRGLTDLFNIDDRFTQAQEGGTAGQREEYRDAQQVQKVKAARAAWAEFDRLNPNWRKDSSLLDNISRVTGSFLGDTAGNANPTYLIGFGKNLIQRALAQGGVNAGIDALLQGNEMREGIQDEFDPARMATQFAAGMILQGGLEGGAKLLGRGEAPRGRIQDDFDSSLHPEETIIGDLNPTHAAEEDILSPEARARLENPKDYEGFIEGYNPDEVNYRTPEEEQLVQNAIQKVSSDWGVPPDKLQDDPAMFTRVEKAIEEQGGQRGLLDKEMAPEPEARPDEIRDEVVGMRQIANQIHIDAETGGGQYNIGQIGAILKALDEREAAGKFNPSEMEEVGNIRAFLEDAAVIHSGRQTQAEIDAGVADAPPPVQPVQPNRGAGETPVAANDTGGGGEVPTSGPTDGGGEPPRPVEERLTEALNEASQLTKEQRELYRQERSNRLKAVEAARENTSGKEGLFAELSALEGRMPRVDYEGVEGKFTADEVNQLFDKIKTSEAFGNARFEPIRARVGLLKMLEGEVPAPSELAQLEKVFGKEMIQAVQKHRSRGGKVSDFIANGLNLPRALMASMDLSAPLRQGISLIGTKEFWKAWPDMFKAFGSEKAFNGIMDDIRGRESYPLMEEGKLAITEMGSDLSAREEDFISQWAEKIPGVGIGVKASERAYVGFLNKLRADTFDRINTLYGEAGINLADNPALLKQVAGYVNNATGRGDLGRFNNSSPLLNAAFFSPRLIASRVNLLRPDYYIRLDPVVRKEAVRNLLSFGAIATTVAGLASMAGMDVETDPRSSDFGKLKTGNTRYDILGGFGQYLTLGARLATNEKKTLKGEVQELGKGYSVDTRKDVLEKFFENKLAPVPGYIRDYLQGSDPVGKPFDPASDAAELFIPLFLQDVKDVIQENGVGEGAAMSIPGVFGVGVSTYGSDKPEAETPEEEASETEEETNSNQTWSYVE